MMLTLSVHFSRVADMVTPDYIVTDPPVPIKAYRDDFGNWCHRIVAPPGRIRISANGIINDSGLPDIIVPDAYQHLVQDLPEETLVYLLGSRYCETDQLTEIAWNMFGNGPMGWGRVQAICDFVNKHITFGYEHARVTKTALEVFHERRGVCRDFAHLAITLCRCMNIPARYCTGYLGDIGVLPGGPMDFSAWMQVYLGGQWHVFDPRNNASMPRIGHILIGYGRDAADVPITLLFGPAMLLGFQVWTDELPMS
jgi:transglutaminase-like putative cysteine protease